MFTPAELALLAKPASECTPEEKIERRRLLGILYAAKSRQGKVDKLEYEQEYVATLIQVLLAHNIPVPERRGLSAEAARDAPRGAPSTSSRPHAPPASQAPWAAAAQAAPFSPVPSLSPPSAVSFESAPRPAVETKEQAKVNHY